MAIVRAHGRGVAAVEAAIGAGGQLVALVPDRPSQIALGAQHALARVSRVADEESAPLQGCASRLALRGLRIVALFIALLTRPNGCPYPLAPRSVSARSAQRPQCAGVHRLHDASLSISCRFARREPRANHVRHAA